MGHSNLIKIINEKTNGKFGFLCLKSAVLKKKIGKLVLTFIFPDGKSVSDDQKQEIESIIKPLFPSNLTIEILFKKSFFDEKIVKDKMFEIVEKNYPSFSYFAKKFVDVEIESKQTTVVISVDESLQDFLDTSKVCDSLSALLEDFFCAKFLVQFKFEPIHISNEEVQVQIDDTLASQNPLRIIEVSEILPMFGKDIEPIALYISDIVKPTESVTLCGRINRFSTKKITTKTGKERFLVRFSLKDFTGEMNVVIFASETSFEKLSKLADGIEVVLTGNVEDDEYSHGLSMKAKALALCILPKDFKEVQFFKSENKDYLFVKPENVVQTQQIDLFSNGAIKTNNFLKENDVVVFDLETTGLNFLESEIIEIGAVKLRNGVIVEKFSTLVKPTRPIPADATKVNGITDDDVKSAFSCEQVLPDFFKFTRNSVLVAYNIDFDYGFINYYGKKLGYNFSENKRLDAYALAAKVIKGLKNYKLKSVATHLGVDLTNAHRAVADAVATAEVFVKLADFV